jgi:hypothetical protein
MCNFCSSNTRSLNVRLIPLEARRLDPAQTKWHAQKSIAEKVSLSVVRQIVNSHPRQGPAFTPEEKSATHHDDKRRSDKGLTVCRYIDSTPFIFSA